jgi:hypothetical protein
MDASAGAFLKELKGYHVRHRAARPYVHLGPNPALREARRGRLVWGYWLTLEFALPNGNFIILMLPP